MRKLGVLSLAVICFALMLVQTADAAPRKVRSIGDVCKSYTKKHWLYKQSSQDSKPPREGKPMILFTKNKPNKSYLKVYAANGKEICKFKKYKIENKLGQRYYSGFGCNKTRNQIRDLAKRATKNRSSRIYIEAKGRACVGPFDPTKRADKR